MKRSVLLIVKSCFAAASAALTLVVVVGLGMAITQSAQAQTFTSLYSFTGAYGTGDGWRPLGDLVRDEEGNLYGTTLWGGASGYGTVFKLDTAGTETVLYSFTGGADGAYPSGGLLLDEKGTLYGTTSPYCCGVSGYGTVFQIKKNDKANVLYTFKGGTTDGCNPSGGLVQDEAGNLYGATSYCGSSNWGTVFKLSKAGKETLLHSFTGGADGGYPGAYGTTALLMDKRGSLYGLTIFGGDLSCYLSQGWGCGVFYKLNQNGRLAVLHTFGSGTDGCWPYGTPAIDHDGNFYGTTYGCGQTLMGTVWKLSKDGSETVLHSFDSSVDFGISPEAGVILDATGNVYGNAIVSAYGGGVVFKLDTAGNYTPLHIFPLDYWGGDYPSGGLLLDKEGNLYGTTMLEGDYWSGTVWKLTL